MMDILWNFTNVCCGLMKVKEVKCATILLLLKSGQDHKKLSNCYCLNLLNNESKNPWSLVFISGMRITMNHISKNVQESLGKDKVDYLKSMVSVLSLQNGLMESYTSKWWYGIDIDIDLIVIQLHISNVHLSEISWGNVEYHNRSHVFKALF